MSSVIQEATCPKCDYEKAVRIFDCRTRNDYLQCQRCGYSEDESINYEKSNLPDMIFWEREVIHGNGSYIIRTKGNLGFQVGSIMEGTIEDITEKLEEWDICRYTFQIDGIWFIRDLLTGQEIQFTAEAFLKSDITEDHEDDCEDSWKFE